MYLKIFIGSIALLFFSFTQAQNAVLKGKVVEINNQKKEVPIAYAQVFWLGTQNGAVTNENGLFAIEKDATSHLLVIAYSGYNSDTLEIVDYNKEIKIVLKSGIELDEARIIRRKKSSEISKLTPKLTVNLGRQELQKAACCNLSESFETSPSIDVSFSDALTGTRQIRMLGLDGVYTQITQEMMPSIRGLSSPYGMNFTPGTWVHSIQLTKGVGSVINGFESMAGQINVELKKPDGEELIFADGYVNQGGRTELNGGKMIEINDHVQTGIMAHVSGRPIYTDQNKDGFADNPMGWQANLLNRWTYHNKKGWEGMFGIQGVYDIKKGGQISYLKEGVSSNGYGLDVLNRNINIWTKNGYVFKDKPYQSIGTQLSFKINDLQAEYGNPNVTILGKPPLPLSSVSTTAYSGLQKSAYANLLFSSIIGTTIHTYTTGLSFQWDQISENLDRFSKTNKYARTEYVPGVFVEYNFKPNEDFTLVSGLRADYNNLFGVFITPRLHSRYMFNKDRTVFRLSGGRGQRTAAVFAENQKMYATNRQIVLTPSTTNSAYGLNPEVSWNYGMSLSHEFKINYRVASLNLDLFRTDFVSQVVMDYDYSSTQVNIYNLDGKSYANSAQIMFEAEPFKRADVRIAYRYFDVKTEQVGGLLEKALMSPHRAFVNMAYQTKKKWMFDVTVQWYGKSRMPITTMSTEAYVQPAYSQSYLLVNAQISKQIKKEFMAYVGIENATNYRQNNPIVSADNPFHPNFDSSMIWGPIFGTMVNAGFRYTLEREKNKSIQ
jgi:outer membrane receptor for ferrienterochelin and colicins